MSKDNHLPFFTGKTGLGATDNLTKSEKDKSTASFFSYLSARFLGFFSFIGIKLCKKEKYFITRVIPIIQEMPSSPQLHSTLSPSALNRLETLLFPDTGKSLEEWNDRFRCIEETFSLHK